MKVDLFMLACGLLQEPAPGTTDADLMALLARHAELFLRAGGVVTLDWWGGLDPLTKAAFAEAGDKVAAERSLVPREADRQAVEDAQILRTLDQAAARALKEIP